MCSTLIIGGSRYLPRGAPEFVRSQFGELICLINWKIKGSRRARL